MGGGGGGDGGGGGGMGGIDEDGDGVTSCDGDCDHKEAADAAPAAHGPSQTSGESRKRTGRPKRATQAETRRNSRTQPQFTAN